MMFQRAAFLIVIVGLSFIPGVIAKLCDTNVLDPLSSVVHTASKLGDLLLGGVLGIGNSDNGRRKMCTLPGGTQKQYSNQGQWSGTPYPRCDIPVTLQIYGHLATFSLNSLEKKAGFTRDQLTSIRAMFKNEVFTSTNFDQRPLFVLTHGFFSPQFPPWISKAKDSLLAQGFNVVLLLWDSMNNKIPDYYGSVADTRIVSDILALFIEALVAEGLVSVDKIVLLGHSLGAHICGMAGKQIFNLHGIIALDPAGPFFDCHPDIGLTKNSAQQVQVLHTDFVGLSRYGTNMDRGHIDYYVNKDRGVQPGCPPTTPPVPLVDPFTTFLCNHFRVLLIFNEAIAVNAVDNCRFVAVREANEGGRLKIDVFSPDALARLVDRRFSSLQPVAGRFIFDTTSDVDHLCQKVMGSKLDPYGSLVGWFNYMKKSLLQVYIK